MEREQPAAALKGQHKALPEQQGLALATAANGDGTSWRGKDTAQLVPFGFDLESTGVLATEQEGGRRERGVTHKNIGVSMRIQLPEDRKEEGTCLEEKSPACAGIASPLRDTKLFALEPGGLGICRELVVMCRAEGGLCGCRFRAKRRRWGGRRSRKSWFSWEMCLEKGDLLPIAG